MNKEKTTKEAMLEVNKAMRNLFFEITKSMGILWLIGKIPFLEYKDWVKIRLENEKFKEKL